VAISARTGEGIEELYEYIDHWISSKTPKICFRLPLSEKRVLNRILKSGKVIYKKYLGSDVFLETRIDHKLARNLKRFAVPPFSKNI
jgi:50S ribosomal subunit-associated GTPase HflX